MCDHLKIASFCPDTCGVCKEFGCADATLPFKFFGKKKKEWTCEELNNKQKKIIDRKCAHPRFYTTCRETCGSCPSCNLDTFMGSTLKAINGKYTHTIENFGQDGSQWIQSWDSRRHLNDLGVSLPIVLIGTFNSFETDTSAMYTDGDKCWETQNPRDGVVTIIPTSNPNQHGKTEVKEPKLCNYEMVVYCYEGKFEFHEN